MRAANTLLSADGASARGSLGRFRQVYEGSKDTYNRSLSTIYDGTFVQPPLLCLKLTRIWTLGRPAAHERPTLDTALGLGLLVHSTQTR